MMKRSRSGIFNVVCTSVAVLQSCMFTVSGSETAPGGPSSSMSAATTATTASQYSNNTPAAKVSIGIARLPEIIKGSIAYKRISDRTMKMQKSLQDKFDAMQKEIELEVKKIESAKKSGVAEKTVIQKQNKLQSEVMRKQQGLQKEQAKIQSEQQNQTMEIIRQVKLIFRNLGEKYGLTLVIDSEILLFYSPEKTIDLTQEALEVLNSVDARPADTPAPSPKLNSLRG